MAHHQLRAGLGLLLFALTLPLTVLSDSLELSLIGALGVFCGGLIVGYQVVWMGRALASDPAPAPTRPRQTSETVEPLRGTV